jgi:hypothetical protein
MTDKQTPPNWVLIEAAKRSGWQVLDGDLCVPRYWLNNNGAFRALCDMIERYEQPPVDRKLLCAREAMSERFPDLSWDENDGVIAAAVRAIELWDEGFGK